MKYYIIAGEASGDLHGSNLIKALKAKDPSADFRCWGGDLMQTQGAEIVKHYRELAFMGFLEVILNLNTIIKNLKFCKKDILSWKPDAVILIDYPGFNLRIAEFAHENNFKVIYYISPQIWAWKQSRVHKIKKVVDKMLVILPFEKAFYAKFDYDVDFVGHPLLDALEHDLVAPKNWRQKNGLTEAPIIALLPGSRKQEISSMLPLMIETYPKFKDYQYVIAAAPSIPLSYYESFLNGSKIKIIEGGTYALLSESYAALVTSGTATLETALFEVPEVVCYKGNSISYQIAKKMVKIKFISLVNLVMDREVVKELIQEKLTPSNLVTELNKLLNPITRDTLIEDYKNLKLKLGGKGASLKAAEIIIDLMKKNSSIK